MLNCVCASTGCVCPSQTSIQTHGTPPGPCPPSSQVCSASWWRKAPPSAALRPPTTPWAPDVPVELLLVMSEIADVHLFLFFQKRQLSAQSLAFNLKDKVFCELFPDVVDVGSSTDQMCPVFILLSAGLTLLSCPPPGDEAETEGPGGVTSPHPAPPSARCGARWRPPASPLRPPCHQRCPRPAAGGQPRPGPGAGQSQPWTSGRGFGQPVCDRRLCCVRLHRQIRAEEHSSGVKSISRSPHPPPMQMSLLLDSTI